MESHAVDTGQHLILFIVLPVCTGLLGDLESLQSLGVGQVRSDAHIDVLALLEEAELGLVGQVSHAGQDEGLDGQILFGDLAHLLLDVGQVFVGQLGVAEVNVVVEAVLGGGAEGEVSLRVEALDGLSHNVGCGMTDNVQFLVLRALVHMTVLIDDLHGVTPS